MVWSEVVKGFSKKEENCLISLISNGHDNCFTRKTFLETIRDGHSIKSISTVIKKLTKKNLGNRIPQNIFTILWGWIYEPDINVIAAYSFF